MRKKRILFFDHTSKMSGGERSLLLILEKINRKKFEPFLITPEPGPLSKEARTKGVETEYIVIPEMILERKRTKTGILFLLLSFITSFPGILQLVSFIKRKKIDLIYTNSQKAHLIGLLAGLFSHIPVVWHFRDILNEGYIKKTVKFLGIQFTKNIISISRAVAAQFKIAERINRKVKVVYNAIDVLGFEEKRKNSKTNLRKEYGLPQNSKIIACVGQIARWKGQEYLIYVARKLVKRLDNLYFFIIGKTLFKESDYNEKLLSLVREFGLEKRVFFTGFRWDIPGIMYDIDILLHTPCEPEPFGRVLIEAMVAGTPIVAFDNGATGEILRSNAGQLVPPFDIGGLEYALTKLLDDRAFYKKVVHRAKDDVRERFDSHILIERIEEILAG
ncbi:MAG: glycosyltransferase family 1 protein [Candidatus Cloacimonadota bacterium]|nr:MAG: glycosyltransferase family 1 protein [Candidatus Cloacimonadota bacterium]